MNLVRPIIRIRVVSSAEPHKLHWLHQRSGVELTAQLLQLHRTVCVKVRNNEHHSFQVLSVCYGRLIICLKSNIDHAAASALVLTASCQDNIGMPVPVCQTSMDFAAATDDGADLLFVYWYTNFYSGLPPTERKIISTCLFATRGHPYKLFLTRCFTDVRKYFFCNRVVKVWSELPSDTDFTCINSFKRRLTSFNLNIYCDHD